MAAGLCLPFEEIFYKTVSYLLNSQPYPIGPLGPESYLEKIYGITQRLDKSRTLLILGLFVMRSHYVAQPGLNLVTILPQAGQCWDYNTCLHTWLWRILQSKVE